MTAAVNIRATLDDILAAKLNQRLSRWAQEDLRNEIMAAFRLIPEDLITEGVRERTGRGSCTHHLTVIHSTEEPCPWPT